MQTDTGCVHCVQNSLGDEITCRLSQENSFNFLKNKIIREDMEDILSRNQDYSQLYGKTVLVSGAYGMLASYFLYFLIYLNETKNYGIKIISVSRNINKLFARFGEYANREYFINYVIDINKPIVIDGGVDYIIHAASLASSQYYMTSPREVALPNVLGTYNCLELAREKQVNGFLFFSTGSVYGKTEKQYLYENDTGTIDSLDIHSCYDESKRMGETLCKIYQHQFGIPTKIARLSHTYGPTLDLQNDSRVFAEFVRNAVNQEDIVMKSDGLSKRAFCYIADATAGEFKVLLDGVPGEAYNISNQDELYTIRDLASIVAELGGVQFIQAERIGDYLEAPFTGIGHNRKLCELGWECRYDVRNGFRRTINNFKER